MEMMSPSLTTTSPARKSFSEALIRSDSAPTTAGLPQPRATTACSAHEASPGGEDAFGRQHSVHVFGEVAAHEDHADALFRRGRGVIGAETRGTDRGAGRGRKSLCNYGRRVVGELWMQRRPRCGRGLSSAALRRG